MSTDVKIFPVTVTLRFRIGAYDVEDAASRVRSIIKGESDHLESNIEEIKVEPPTKEPHLVQNRSTIRKP